MICPECELEVDYLTRAGACKQCQVRRNQINYLNRKNGTNIQYVPVKDLKYTDPVNYKKIMTHRKSAQAKRNKLENKNIIKSDNTKEMMHDFNDLNAQSEIVDNDIKETFAKYKIQFPKDSTSIVPIFQQLKVLLDDYIGVYLTAEDCLNKMELDYKHAKEYYTTLFKENYNKLPVAQLNKIAEQKKIWEDRHSLLLDKRRGIKNVIAEYNTAGVLFTELANNKEFMKKFNSYYDSLLKVNNIISQKNYRAEVSQLVAKEEFVLGFKTDVTNTGLRKYNVVIPTLFNGHRSTFTKTVEGCSKQEAIQKVLDFIEGDKERFKFSYKRNEITATEITKLSKESS